MPDFRPRFQKGVIECLEFDHLNQVRCMIFCRSFGKCACFSATPCRKLHVPKRPWGSLPENLPHFSKTCPFFCHHLEICGRKSYTPRVPKKTVPGFLPPIGLPVVENRPPSLRICALFACCKKLGDSYSAISGRPTENMVDNRARL